jgi:hypothetical protein
LAITCLISHAAEPHDLRTPRRPLRRSVTSGQQLWLGRVRPRRTECETQSSRQVLTNSHRCVRDRGPSRVRLGSTAEILPFLGSVSFTPESRRSATTLNSSLSANTGHSRWRALPTPKNSTAEPSANPRRELIADRCQRAEALAVCCRITARIA